MAVILLTNFPDPNGNKTLYQGRLSFAYEQGSNLLNLNIKTQIMSKILHGKEYDLIDQDLDNIQQTLAYTKSARDYIWLIDFGLAIGTSLPEKEVEYLLGSPINLNPEEEEEQDKTGQLLYTLCRTNKRTLKKWLKSYHNHSDILNTIIFMKDRYTYRLNKWFQIDDFEDKHKTILENKLETHRNNLTRYIADNK